MPARRFAESALTAWRKMRIAKGALKELLLPENVVFIVHKPGHEQYSSSVNDIFKWYGITSLGSSKKRFGKLSVRENYEHVFRKLARTKPDVVQKILDEYSAKKLCHKNIRVEVLHVPQRAIKSVGARNAWDAMKKIAGRTNPDEAMREMLENGEYTLRGAVQFAVKNGLLKARPLDGTRNLVHVPDADRILIKEGYLTGRLTDADLFLNAFDIGRALVNYQRLKRKGLLK